MSTYRRDNWPWFKQKTPESADKWTWRQIYNWILSPHFVNENIWTQVRVTYEGNYLQLTVYVESSYMKGVLCHKIFQSKCNCGF